MRSETEILRQMRIKNKLTQHQMAKTFGWKTAQFVSNAERGLAGFPVEHLRTVTETFGGYWTEKIIRAKIKDFEAQIRRVAND